MSMFARTALAAALLAAAPLAMAASPATDQFEVSITIENSCTVLVGDLTFPTSDSLTTAVDAQTTGAVTCTGIGAYEVSFNDGIGTGATTAARKMTGPGSATIDYTLARDSATGGLLGDDAGAVTFTGTSVGNDIADTAFTIYGRVAASQNPKPIGVYSDTVTASVSF